MEKSVENMQLSSFKKKIIRDKIINLENLLEKIKNSDSVFGFTNGCFDILHAGHLHYLVEAASKVDKLIVGLNSDSSVKRLKGDSRPLVNQDDRAYLLAGLEPVDFVVIFADDTPIELIKKIKPNLYFKGGDYYNKDLPEREVVESQGGKVVLLPFIKGKSTTAIIDKIKESF